MTNQTIKRRLALSGHTGRNPFTAFLAVAMIVSASGCTSLFSPMSGVPVKSLPPQLMGESRNNLVQVPLALMRMEKPDEYVLAEGDILGIYIEGVMPPKADEDQVAAAPPVHFPEPGSDLPPSVGFPIPVRDDGTLPLPLVEPIYV